MQNPTMALDEAVRRTAVVGDRVDSATTGGTGAEGAGLLSPSGRSVVLMSCVFALSARVFVCVCCHLSATLAFDVRGVFSMRNARQLH